MFNSTGHKPVICKYTTPQCMMNGFQYGGDGGDVGGGDDGDDDDDDYDDGRMEYEMNLD